MVRKGRENYLCLLNMQDAVDAGLNGLAAGAASCRSGCWRAGRWRPPTATCSAATCPAGSRSCSAPATLGLADRRGECIHAACDHYRRCFVEHTIRRARGADLVVANHALVMAQAAWGGIDDASVPLRYVFDEGHHLFDAADGAFAVALSGWETADLRRWLLGAEGGRSRARGLRRRIEDLVAERPDLQAPLDAALQAARALPALGWTTRLAAPGPELTGLEPGRPNPTEAFLALIRQQVLARQPDPDPGPFGARMRPSSAAARAAAGGGGARPRARPAGRTAGDARRTPRRPAR